MIKLPKIEELLEAGVHFGHQVRRGHPRMRPFIYGARDGVHIIDLTKSEEYLKIAAEYLEKIGTEGKILLFVGTKKQARPIVEECAQKLEAPYMTERWVGGFLTNFEGISKNVKRLKDLKEQKEKGELKKYTKKEQVLIDREIAKLERDYKGVLALDKLPDALFVVDAVTDEIAVNEANKLGIPVVAIADSNCNPQLIDYPIPGNDDAIKSIKILVETVAQAFESGKAEAGKVAAKAAEKAAKDAAKEAAKTADPEIDEELKVDVDAAEEKVEKETVKDADRVVK